MSVKGCNNVFDKYFLPVKCKNIAIVTKVRRPFYTPIFWWSHQPNHQIKITNFSVSCHRNVLYNSVVIADMKCLSQPGFPLRAYPCVPMQIFNIELSYAQLKILNGNHDRNCILQRFLVAWSRKNSNLKLVIWLMTLPKNWWVE